MSLRILDDALEEEILAGDHERWLILEASSYAGHWEVCSLGREFIFDLDWIIGRFHLVSPATLEEFMQAATEDGYEVVFAEDPAVILDAFAHLSDEPEIVLDSQLPNTINGFLPFQVAGFNKLKTLDGGVALWDTGTGKSVLAAGLTKYHEQCDHFDLSFYVVKSHNKVNTSRSLLKLAGVQSLILDGTLKKRERLYEEILDRLDAGQKTVVITNYEKFRDDFVTFKTVVTEDDQTIHVPQLEKWVEPIFTSRLWIVWDEMPTKLRNRTSRVYKAVVKCLYRTNSPSVNWERLRPAELRQLMTTATPIENSPEDWFNCERILSGGRTYGTAAQFRDHYVAYYDRFDRNRPKGWHKFDEMQMVATGVVHRVSKEDPGIKEQFPEAIPETIYIDWDPKQRKVYDRFAKELAKRIEEDPDEGIDGQEGVPVLAAITVMQMLCNAPETVSDSAALRAAYLADLESDPLEAHPRGSEAALKLVEALDAKLTNDNHTKLEELRSLIVERHPDEKILVFSAYNSTIMPTLEALLVKWGVSYVRYGGTLVQQQAALDAFKSDPDIRVFLSSDAGSDSISLEEATVVIHFDMPWKWSTRIQRENRIHRVISAAETVHYYSLIMADSIEERKLSIIERKRAYHEAVFGGAITDEAVIATLTRDDLLYILTG